jgi:hypothetical protein
LITRYYYFCCVIVLFKRFTQIVLVGNEQVQYVCYLQIVVAHKKSRANDLPGKRFLRSFGMLTKLVRILLVAGLKAQLDIVNLGADYFDILQEVGTKTCLSSQFDMIDAVHKRFIGEVGCWVEAHRRCCY